MGLGEQMNNIQELCKQLETSQVNVEQSAFDTINEHDKLLDLVSSSATYIMELLSTLEILGMELEAEEEHSDSSEACKKISHMIEKQCTVVSEIGQFYDSLMEKHDELSSTIHNLENEIAVHRDSVDMVKKILQDNSKE